MPGFDGTGPKGQGPMTGGGRGHCAVNLSAAGVKSGAGRGRRNCFYATGLPGWVRAQKGMQAFGGFGQTVSREGELDILIKQADLLKQQLENTQTRIQDLESKKGAN